ncbi:hypothetical protein M422DRAFT_246531 [Sphaerobolus stellatus SS14]|nr:hypothetical protein M422DRAFT_246531 [Sphaerobolus stellatus SS14]
MQTLRRKVSQISIRSQASNTSKRSITQRVLEAFTPRLRRSQSMPFPQAPTVRGNSISAPYLHTAFDVGHGRFIEGECMDGTVSSIGSTLSIVRTPHDLTMESLFEPRPSSFFADKSQELEIFEPRPMGTGTLENESDPFRFDPFMTPASPMRSTGFTFETEALDLHVPTNGRVPSGNVESREEKAQQWTFNRRPRGFEAIDLLRPLSTILEEETAWKAMRLSTAELPLTGITERLENI